MEQKIKTGDKLSVSPSLRGLSEWIEGVVIKIFKNPFIGDEIAIKDGQGRIFYGQKNSLKLSNNVSS